MGGLGVPASWALARAGAYRLTLVDPDPVELSNLARQVIYRPSDIGTPKVEAAARWLGEHFPRVSVEHHAIALDASNAARLIAAHDFVIDATDSPATKFLINDTCIGARTPFVYGGVVGMTGQAMTVIPGETACIRCVFETPPDDDEIAELSRGGNRRPGRGRYRRVAGGRGDARLARETLLALRKNSHVRRVRPGPGAFYVGQSAPGMRLRRLDEEDGASRIAIAGQVTGTRKR